jgi:hypothetical protein
VRGSIKILIAFTMILLINVSIGRWAEGSPGTTLSIIPSKNTSWPLNTPGGHGYNDFVADIRVNDVTNLYGWGFWLHWNPAVLNLTNYYESNFIKGPFNFETHPHSDSENITVTNPTDAFDQDLSSYASFTYGQSISVMYQSHPTANAYNYTTAKIHFPTQAYDGDNFTSTSITGNVNGYYTMKTFTQSSGTIAQVDLKMILDAYQMTGPPYNKYRIFYTVSPSTTKNILVDWTTADQYYTIFTWANVAEPNNGVWDWTDVGNINLRVETQLVNAGDTNTLEIYEAWATVKATSNAGKFGVVGFDIAFYNYPVDRVDLYSKLSAQAAVDDQYRIVYYVSPSTTAKVLVDWTSSSKALDTYKWADVKDPNGQWGWDDVRSEASWADIGNIRFVVETKKVGTSDNVEFREYETWAVVKYHRNTYCPEPSIDYATGYIYFGSTATGTVDGVSGNGTIAMLRFVVLTSGTSVLEFAHPSGGEETKLLNPYGGLITHTNVDSSFTAPPWIEDINGDGYVDIFDIALVGRGWGKTSASPDWSTYKDADVNKDNVIDISDLSQVALKWSYGTYL